MSNTTTSPSTGARDTVKTRILIISDTHSENLQAQDAANPFKEPLPQADILLHCGDLTNAANPFKEPLPQADILLHCGDLTNAGYMFEYDTTLDMLGKIDAELKLVIAGNHDLTLDEEYYRRRGKFMHDESFDMDNVRKAQEKWMGEEAKSKGVTYLEEGVHTFELKNGANFTIYTSPYQPEFCNFAFPYARNEDRFNAPSLVPSSCESIVQTPIPDFPAINILMTHGPPHSVLDKTYHTGRSVGCPHLIKAARRARPQLYCFGHIHEGWGAERVRWDLEKEVTAQGTHAEFIAARQKIGRNDLPGHDERPLEEPATAWDGSRLPRRIDRVQYVDVSQAAEQPLKVGEETLMVNAAIMNVRQKPVQAPWVVDLELPRAVGRKL